MFGKPPPSPGNAPQPPPKKASDIARVLGGGLVQVIVTETRPLTYYLFLNDDFLSQMDIESLSLAIEVPNSGNLNAAIVRATLSRYVTTVNGERTLQRSELFPCTIEIIALGRRISVTAMNPDSLDNLWVSLGLKEDGSSNELGGLRSLRFLLSEGFLDAKLEWMDGESEEILPQADIM